MKKIYETSIAVISILFIFMLGGSIANAENIEYIKGYPLTEEEIQAQKEKEPQLSENGMEELEFEPAISMRRSVLPEKYDSRDEGKNIPVKDQGIWGCCWAISAIETAELSSISRGVEFSGDYSEAHLAYFYYNRVDDPLNNTTGDFNILPEGRHYLNNGGNLRVASQALATWSGVADETVMPFYAYGEPQFPDTTDAYRNESILKNAYYFSKDLEEIKSAVLEYGGVSIGYYHNSECMNYNTAAYCDKSDTSTNHSVIIIGWNDNYSKENFREESGVKQDGAWIVQNSWGTEWGKDGCFYLSYENCSTSSPTVLEMQSVSNYDHNYQYDGTASGSYISLNNGEKIANIYQVKGNPDKSGEILKSIALTLFDSNIGYTIEVYKGIQDLSEPENGVMALDEPIKGQTRTAGVLSIDLKDNVLLEYGEYYSVVITLDKISGDKSRVGIEGISDYGWVSFQAGIDERQSFINRGGEWRDLYTSQMCMRIKAFTQDVDSDEIESILLDHSELVMETGSSILLNVKILPESIDGERIKWSSDNEYVASVDNAGNVTTRGYGKCIITASIGKKEAQCSVIVRPSPILNITAKGIDSKSIRLQWGQTQGVDGYIIYRQGPGESKFAYLTMRYGYQNSDFIDTNVEKGEFYFYRVYAYKTIGGERILSQSVEYVYARPTLAAVKKLKAESSGKNKVLLSWEGVKGAEGYLIYRQVGKGKFSYRYMVKKTTFTDNSASDTEYNFYRVYPYFIKDKKQIAGNSDQYVYAKGVTAAVTKLKANGVPGGVKLTWTGSSMAEGYLIYGKTSAKGLYGYRGMTTKSTTYTDKTASKEDYNFYWVYPYHKDKTGKRVIGNVERYVYGLAR